jgi:hypothetical protein
MRRSLGRVVAARRAILLTFSLALLAPAAAAAEPTQAELKEARELFARAEKEERAGDWAAALEHLRRVAQIKVTPGIRFHLGLAEEKTGLLVTALADYALAEKQATDEKNREVLAALREPIAALQARVPRLVVKVPPDVKGIEVALDGKTLAPGLYAAEMPVDPKAHTVEARAPGKKTFARTINAQERDTVTVEVVLEDEAKPGVVAPPPPVTKPPPVSPPPEVVKPPPAAKPAHTEGPSDSKAGAVLATIGAVALIGGGVGAYFMADSEASDARDKCKTMTSCEDLRGPVRTWDAVALGAWVGGAALTTVAIILWVKPSASASASTTGRLYVGPGTAGLAGSF